MEYKYYIKKALSTPPHILCYKIFKKVTQKINYQICRHRDLYLGTNIKYDVSIIRNSHINVKELDTTNINQNVSDYLSDMYLRHRFDLLGSGWVKNSHSSISLGVEGHTFAMNVHLPTNPFKNYELIDWQKDFKSGFRWNEKKWYKQQRIGHKTGSDIKVPWELARLQHLPQLALFCLKNSKLTKSHIYEFKHQVLDFITHNPPRMGVNWVCTMDVAIRASNMLIAYDMFLQIDKTNILNDDFRQTFSNSIYEHGIHIVNNLEYDKNLTSNHYLSDIAGLLYISSFLESDKNVDMWLAFSIQEIISEMHKEFYEDGGNFESSTSYHRLSAELMIYSSAIIMGLNKEKTLSLEKYNHTDWKKEPSLSPLERQIFKINKQDFTITFPQWFTDRLYKIGRFTVDITKPNGEIPQFGDNDSGRFFRLSPNGTFLTSKEAQKKYINLQKYSDEGLFWDENILNHSSLIGAMSGIFIDSIFKSPFKFESSFVQNMSQRVLQPIDKSYSSINIQKSSHPSLSYSDSIIHSYSINTETLHLISYPNSGIYIFKSNNFYLAISITPLGQNGNGGHTHNDKLCYELNINKQDLTKDPGTYLYTALPLKRNMFRSTNAHSLPIVSNSEQNQWEEGIRGLFYLNDNSECSVRNYDHKSIEIDLKYRDIYICRKFDILNTKLVITDKCNKDFKYGSFQYYSNGYGKIIQH